MRTTRCITTQPTMLLQYNVRSGVQIAVLAAQRTPETRQSPLPDSHLHDPGSFHHGRDQLEALVLEGVPRQHSGVRLVHVGPGNIAVYKVAG
jgi:hypothetical protein